MHSEYMIIETSTPQDMMLQVNAYLKDDWLVQGGIAVSQDRVVVMYSQAMVKLRVS